MNCKQVEKLMPLYAGRDLGERDAQLVDAHVQSCQSCAATAAEFRETRQLLQEFSSPAFSQDVYAGIRQNVWRQIESDSRRSLFESMASWFRPRIVWTAAAAMLFLAISAAGIYFVVKGFNVRTEVLVNKPKPAVEQAHGSEEPGSVAAGPREEIPRRRRVNMPKRASKPGHTWAPDRNDSVVAYSPHAQGTMIESSPASPVIGTNDPDIAVRDSEKTLRMEIQTRNPNIRIIWFSQPD
jgi:hypothetical protein